MSKLRDILGSAVVVFCVVLVSKTPCEAAQYYVDYSSGSDANSGTNQSVSWQHCPGDAAAIGVPAAITLKAGDLVWFKQGVTYVFTVGIPNPPVVSPGIQCYWSGVTYASTNAWTTATGAGKARFTDNYAQGYHYVAFWDYYGASNLTFDTLNIGPMGGSATLPADTGSAIGPNEGDGIVFDCTAVNILVKNCDFHDCGYSFNQKPMSAGSIVGAGIVVLNTGLSGMTVTNCTFGNSAGGLSIGYENAYSTGLKISSCTFTDGIVWGIDLHGEANACQLDNVTIDHNKFINWDTRFSTVNWTGYSEWPHCNAIFQRPGSQGDVSTGCNSSTNVNIHDNEVYDTEPGGSGTSGFWLATAGGNIYNNLFAISGSGTPALELSAGLQSHTNTLNNCLMRVYNNTFVVSATTAAGNGAIRVGCDGSATWPAQAILDVRNNIFYDFRTATAGGDQALIYTDTINNRPTSWTIDDNDYRSLAQPNALWNWSGGGGEMGITALRSLGYETHGLTSDPTFLSLANGSGATSWLDNYGLAANSPCVGAGVNLSGLNLPGLNADRTGNPRPASGNWDIGAYQH